MGDYMIFVHVKRGCPCEVEDVGSSGAALVGVRLRQANNTLHNPRFHACPAGPQSYIFAAGGR